MSTFIVRLDPGRAAAGVTRVAVKDLIDMEGLPTTWGSKVVAARGTGGAVSDAACLAGIRAAEKAGAAVIVGKTNLHELAFGVSGINPWYGTPVNPLDPRLVPGGSSSGSAVAVASGEADVALGTDTGGSIRIPAACCGIVGLKTTRGRVGLTGVQPLAPSLDTVGPMAATVEGVAAGMSLLEPGFEWRGGAPAQRIGRFRPPAEDWVDEAVDRMLSRHQGEVVDVELPGWGAATDAMSVILMSEAWSVHEKLWRENAGELSPDVAARLEMGSMIDRTEVAAAWEQARTWAAELAAVLAQVDVIALPVLAGAPPPIDEAARMTSLRYTGPFNLAGVPALAVPALAVPAPGAGGAGADPPVVPASLQLVGPGHREDLLLRTALAIEEEGRAG
ncbi:MAG TPA: amidase [Acidimicrobiales bacterium]|nr:amidase [Acidimicrobiales bacterium]